MPRSVPAGRLAAALVLALAAAPALAHDDGHDDGRDHDRARRALERGEVLPLAEILARVRPAIDGDVVATGFEREHGRWVYEIRFVDRRGRLVELHVDAATGAVIGRGKD